MNPALYQALVRAARTVGAAVIAAAVTILPQMAGIVHFDPAPTGVVVGLLTAFLNGVGKLIRGESVDVAPDAGGDKLPI